MVLKYVGPKPIITHMGISFDTNKEDKFIYLNVAVALIKALDHEYEAEKTYIYHIDNYDKISESEITNTIKKYCADKVFNERAHMIEDEIDENLKSAEQNRLLDETEKEVLMKNIELMHDYMVQRSINKSAYYCLMDLLADIMKKNKIDHITMPMAKTTFHVLHTLEGTALKENPPIDTKIDIYRLEGQFFIKFQVVKLGQ